uniref:Musculoskeletal embryonic nuclear protein 1 n=1 Tax=Fundulus heteroclitus TaxID=8078 RepID=A0A3Q2QAU5_FUNHE
SLIYSPKKSLKPPLNMRKSWLFDAVAHIFPSYWRKIGKRMGKAAPSVFSGVRTGTETVLAKPAAPKDPSASVFSK